VRAATLEISVRGYVEAAVARGERAAAVIAREVLPNILGPVLVDAGLRFTYSILIVSSVIYLGLGLEPPSSNWALMISENREFISINSLSVLAPAAMIALLTIGVNLMGDAIARSLGRSYIARGARSVTASATALALSVSAAIRSAGTATAQGCSVIPSRFSEIIVAQSAPGGCRPSPRKLMAAIDRIALA